MIRSQTTAYKAFAITPGDDQLERPPTHGLMVCEAGDITMLLDDGAGDYLEVTLVGVTAGTRIELVPAVVSAATATVIGLF